MRVNILILNWNGGAYLPDCLAALKDQTYQNYRITLIDNGSTDGSVAAAREQYPALHIIETGANLGFAAGNNAALNHNTAEIVALLNPDVIVSSDWLATMVETFDSDPRIGIVGSKLWYPDGRTIQHGGGFLLSPQAMPGHHAIGEPDRGQVDVARDVDYVIGGAMAIRAEVLEQIGLLDDGYFLYYEDADYCQRARRAGRRVVYAPAATAVHVESATTVKGSFRYLQQFHTGRWRYILKHYPEDTIIDETLTAEGHWLATVDLDERLAVALACQLTLGGWDELLVARSREGAGPLSTNAAGPIRTGMLSLRDAAWALPGDLPDATHLDELANVTEPEFTSAIPFVAAFRSAWNGVAAEPYVRPLLGQQNAFNGHLAQIIVEKWQLLENEFVRLSELQAIHATLQEEARALAQMNRECQQLVVELETRAAALQPSGASD